jgi:hypothetical protein
VNTIGTVRVARRNGPTPGLPEVKIDVRRKRHQFRREFPSMLLPAYGPAVVDFNVVPEAVRRWPMC